MLIYHSVPEFNILQRQELNMDPAAEFVLEKMEIYIGKEKVVVRLPAFIPFLTMFLLGFFSLGSFNLGFV